MAGWVMGEETKAQSGSATGAGHTARKVQLREPTRHGHWPVLSVPRVWPRQEPSSPSAPGRRGLCAPFRLALAVREREAAAGGRGWAARAAGSTGWEQRRKLG